MANNNITLSAPIRSNLLTLQNTSSLIGRTETRLASGLRVASPIDDAVAYFQAKALSDRGEDMAEKKDGIDQGISQLQTAMTAITSVETIVKQMKGLLLSAKSSTDQERSNLMEQFNVLSMNVNSLASDSIYQGMNLVAGTTARLTVDFSMATNSRLNIQGVDLRTSRLMMSTGPASTMGIMLLTDLRGDVSDFISAAAGGVVFSTGGGGWSVIGVNVSIFDAAVRNVDTSLSRLRGFAKSLGSNIALLQTRLDFTKTYVNTLTEGSGKLTLADMNEEGANLVALQTRQQLGMQALQFSGQAEQAVLQLFR